jgi:hypothetical protein
MNGDDGDQDQLELNIRDKEGKNREGTKDNANKRKYKLQWAGMRITNILQYKCAIIRQITSRKMIFISLVYHCLLLFVVIRC